MLLLSPVGGTTIGLIYLYETWWQLDHYPAKRSLDVVVNLRPYEMTHKLPKPELE